MDCHGRDRFRNRLPGTRNVCSQGGNIWQRAPYAERKKQWHARPAKEKAGFLFPWAVGRSVATATALVSLGAGHVAGRDGSSRQRFHLKIACFSQLELSLDDRSLPILRPGPHARVHIPSSPLVCFGVGFRSRVDVTGERSF